MKSNSSVSSRKMPGRIIYCGKKENLVGAGVADEEDFPVWPKRKSHSGTGPRGLVWSIAYLKGGEYEVEHWQSSPGAEGALPFVCVEDDRISYWSNDRGMEKASLSEEVLIGRLYFTDLMRYIRRASRCERGFSVYHLLESIEEDMPESSWRKHGFKQEMDSFLIGASRVLDLEAEARRLKSELIACKMGELQAA